MTGLHSFCGWTVFRSVHVPNFPFPVICSCTLKLILQLTTVNSAAMNRVQIVQHTDPIPSGYLFRSGTSAPYGTSYFEFWGETSYCFPYWLYWFAFPPIVCQNLLLSTSLPTFIFHLSSHNHSDRCETFHFAFDPQFCGWLVTLNIFFIPVGCSCMLSFKKRSI
jgi:hypothetical protein